MFKDLRKKNREDENIDKYTRERIMELENALRHQDGPRNARDPREKTKAVALEALKKKDLNTGRNLLMYAAFEGALESFNSLVKVIRSQVRQWRHPSSLKECDIGNIKLANSMKHTLCLT